MKSFKEKIEELKNIIEELTTKAEESGMEDFMGFILGSVVSLLGDVTKDKDESDDEFIEQMEAMKAINKKSMEALDFIKKYDVEDVEWENVFTEEEVNHLLKFYKGVIRGMK